MELDRLKQRLEGLEDTTLRRFNWRAVCNESCKHGAEGGQGYSESFFRNHLPYPTYRFPANYSQLVLGFIGTKLR